MVSLHLSAGTEFGLELAAGYAWDDNLGLDEVERATGESDEVTTLEAQGSALFSYKDRASMRISAGLVDDRYRKFSQVDRRTESVGVNLETQVGKLTAGINWFDVSADLDDKQFLKYERLSLSVGLRQQAVVCAANTFMAKKRLQDDPVVKPTATASLTAFLQGSNSTPCSATLSSITPGRTAIIMTHTR